MQQPTIVMPIYPGVTHLDFTGPHQFFSRVPGMQVLIASLGAKPVEADGLTFCSLANLETIEACDVVCVPGGAGCVTALEDDLFLHRVRHLGASARFITSVCTGSLILGAAGLIAGKRAACHWAWRDMLTRFDAIPDSARVVRDGNVLTGGGVTAGMDFALTLISELAGPETAQAVQLGLEYAPAPPFNSGTPDTAPPDVLKAVRERIASGSEDRRKRVELVASKRALP